MRNLKKILALVLALVMSLSLMATASAADFGDASSISDNYKTAVNVLSQLEVFKGYAEDGTFRPQGEITRAEVATIIYRIATGDAKDAQASIYTNMTTSFTDLDKAEWARGYVNYCHNAQIIKGESATKFNPNGKITGYATLAMILRAMGYGRNGEFEGSQWEITTAAKAKEIGLIDNVIEAQLGSNAPRELVAEILFRALLTEMVDYTVLNGYVPNGKTLGYENFKLEELEGVIVANEFANLYGTSVLSNGKTNLEVAKDDIRSLATTTEITDIGMRQHVYITGPTVLDMDDTDLNKVTETGAATDISTASKFSATAEMSQGNSTEFYTNFGHDGYYTSDYRIEYVIDLALSEAEALHYNNDLGVLSIYRDDGQKVQAYLLNGDPARDAAGNLRYWYAYDRVIKVGEHITQIDMANLRTIFYESNGLAWRDDNTTDNNYIGKVFVGTQTKKDISDDISYNEFVDTYINDELYAINWLTSVNGDWVKFIDNDLDGVCDYAFLTRSWLDEATGTYTKGDNTYTEYNYFNEEDDTVRYMDGDVAVGDVVVAALIDGQILVEHAEDVTKTVNVYNWRDDTITTTDGDNYGQSGITNRTNMQGLLKTMDEKTEYVLYFDHFGYVRAYKLPGGTQYALLTEMYYTNNAHGNVVQDWPMKVELKAGDAATAEYDLTGSSSVAFRALAAWTQTASLVNNAGYNNWLQPAIAHLGVTRVDNAGNSLGPVRATPRFTGGNYQFWPSWAQVVNGGIVPGVDSNLQVSREFNYGTQNIGVNNAPQANTVSFTNVAAVSINGDSASLTGAAQLRLDSNGNLTYWPDGTVRYAVDYVQLSTDNVVAKQTMYPVNANYGSWKNSFVNAVHDTQYYIVHNGGVEYFTDYEKMPALNENNYIHAAYAVARDTSDDNAGSPYWVADVIVYEVRTYNDDTRTSIALAYFNQSRTTGDVQLLKTLSNAKGGPEVDLVPAAWNNNTLAWGADRGSFGNFAGYDFYQVWNGSDVEDGQMSARKISPIPEAGKYYDDYGIYAGIVNRVNLNASNGGYITVTAGGKTYSLSVNDNIYSITNGQELGSTNTYNEANKLRYNNMNSTQVIPGDLVIWQGSDPTSANWITSAFIVDLGNSTPNEVNYPLFQRTVRTGFLWNASATNPGLYQRIVARQTAPASTSEFTVTIEKTVPAGYTGNSSTVIKEKVATLSAGTDFDVTLAGYTPDGLDIVNDTTNGEVTATAGDLTVANGSLSGTSTKGTTLTLTETSGSEKVEIDSISDNVVITVNYTWAEYDVTGQSAWGTGVSGVEAAYVSGTVSPAPSKKNLSDVAKLEDVHYKDTIRLTVTLTAPVNTVTQDVIVTVTGDTSHDVETLTASATDGAGNFYVNFTMPDESVTVNAEVVNKAIGITVNGDAGVTNATASGSTYTLGAYAAGKATGTWRWAADATTTVTLASGYMIDTVTVEVDGVSVPKTAGLATNWSDTATTVVLDDGGACINGKNVVITITTKEAEHAIDIKSAAAPNAWDLGQVVVTKNSNWVGTLYSFDATPATPVTTDVTAAVGQTVYFRVNTSNSGVTPTVTVADTSGTVTYAVVEDTAAETALGTDDFLGYFVVNAAPTTGENIVITVTKP